MLFPAMLCKMGFAVLLGELQSLRGRVGGGGGMLG